MADQDEVSEKKIPDPDLDAWNKLNGPIPERPESSRPRDGVSSNWLDIEALFR